jgi:hypothetical protein
MSPMRKGFPRVVRTVLIAHLHNSLLERPVNEWLVCFFLHVNAYNTSLTSLFQEVVGNLNFRPSDHLSFLVMNIVESFTLNNAQSTNLF